MNKTTQYIIILLIVGLSMLLFMCLYVYPSIAEFEKSNNLHIATDGLI